MGVAFLKKKNNILVLKYKIKILWKPKIYVENIKETLLCQMVNQ
jgi:hypothetical protein